MLAARFPSPVGDLYFSMEYILFHRMKFLVSVPCRGLIFLNAGDVLCERWKEMFPSPVGDLYFSIVVREAKKQTQKCVSVPCRGLIFLNKNWWVKKTVSWVSVPCRGLIFLNKELEIEGIKLTAFPSPVGDLYFSICVTEKHWTQVYYCFRPLSGTYISQWSTVNPMKKQLQFPSPVGDLYFSINKHFM